MTLGPAQLAALRCPHDGAPLVSAAGTVRCASGHAFDVARQGYVNLVVGRDPGTGDDAAMVAARAAVLGHGVLDGLTDLLGRTVATHLEATPGGDRPDPAGRLVVDLGGGTGHHLAGVLDRVADGHGLSLDLSKAASRRAARRHPRLGAVVADVWRDLPLRSGSAAVVLCVFAPRNGAEIARVLRPGGVLVVATPRPDHLAELVGPLGLVGVDPRKDERLAAAFAGHLRPGGEVRAFDRTVATDHATARALVAMGPSADHLDGDELDRRIAVLPDPVTVTLAVDVRTYRPT